MNRRLIAVTGVMLVVGAIAAAFYARRQRVSTLPVAISSGSAQSPAPAPVLRGAVDIDPRRQQLIGVRTVAVERRTLAAAVRTTGTIRADETRQTDVNVRLDGWIRELFVNYTGQPVRRGDQLFTLYSPELLATTSELQLALKNREQAKTAVVGDAVIYAEQLVAAARRRLALWDLSAQQLADIEAAGRPLDTITITAPASGIVTDKQATAGMRVTTGQTLYRITDLSSVWVEADLYEQDLAVVRVGQRASISLDAYPNRQWSGRAVYVIPTVNEQTRTGRVRFQFDNPAGLLKPGMFANVEIREGGREGLAVPVNAVLDSGAEQVVFVAEGDGRFAPRRVKVGQRLSDVVEILDGLKAGDQVAASATFFLDSESQLRAGLQNYESTTPGPNAAPPSGPALEISFRAQPDPPKIGDNAFEVRVTTADQMPVTDASVSVQLFMPAMPTMNMPAIRNEAALPHVGDGVYRGPGRVMTAGRWEVTVVVTRNGQRLGSRQFPLVAR